MADLKQLEDRLKEIGCNFRFWGRAELRELANVLMPGEIVEHCVNGQYSGGFAMLAATDQRVLLIDKKPMYLTLEDTRYDMVAEVDFNHRLMDASIYIRTPSKSLQFTAYNQARLRKLFNFVQKRVMEIRQHYQQVASQQFAQQFSPSSGFGMQPQLAQQLQPYVAQPYGQQPAVQQIQPPQYSQQLMQRTVAPIISAYTRLPMMSRQRRFLGSRAINTPTISTTPASQVLYPGGQPQLQ